MSEPGEDLDEVTPKPMSAQARLRPRLRSRPSPVSVPKKPGNIALELAAKIITPESYRHARGLR
jgi:hypothetical protein